MTTNPNDFVPPVPRGQDAPTESELIPFKSTKINIWKSKMLVPLMLAGLVVVAMFFFPVNSKERFFLYFDLIGCFGVAVIFLSIYYYSGQAKPWWWYLVPGLIGFVIVHALFTPYALFFRHVLPGNISALAKDASFLPTFIAYFFGAGMCEELVKATPVLLAFALTLQVGLNAGGTPPTIGRLISMNFTAADIRSALQLRGPLDGMLMGLAAGAAFILDETLLEYVPRQVGSFDNEILGLLKGFQLLIPRILQGVSGHMAWAGIFGYFIGLAARYPSQWIKLLAIGYLFPSLLHGLWDSVSALPFFVFWYGAVTVATVLGFVACLLKAKQLDLAWSGPSVSADSILVGAPAGAPRYVPPPPTAAPGTPGAGGWMSTLRAATGTANPPAPAPAYPPQYPAAAPPPMPAAPATNRFAIGVGATRFALENKRSIDFGALFGGMGAPAGATGEISQHPQDPNVLGLKNTGTFTWTAINPDGSTATVPPGRNLRIAAGTRLMFGQLALDIQSY